MQKLLLALAALSLAGPCLADAPKPPDVSVAFGNTVISTYPDKRQGHLWIKKDGTNDYAGRRNTPSSGAWTIKGDKICLKQKKPIAAPFTYCTTAPDGQIGASWKAKAVTGEQITVSVVKGIVKGSAPAQTASR